MSKLKVNFLSLFNVVILTVGYGFLLYKFAMLFEQLIFVITALVMGLIIYVNILRNFVLEMYGLAETKASELFTYLILYVVTISIIVSPFVLEAKYVFESNSIRNVIIAFSILLMSKYTIFMLIGPWYDVKNKLKHKIYLANSTYQPLVSVVIPAWNEGVGIINTVKSVLDSTYRHLEIIVVNDGSTDNSDQLIREFLAKYQEQAERDIAIQYVYQSNTGKGGALNRAVSLAQGDLIISIDADCFVEKGAIQGFVDIFKDPSISAAVGNVKIGNKNSTVGIVQYLEFLFSFYFKRVDAILGSIYIIGGAAGAFRREVFEQLGGYSEGNITEDIELTVRIQDAGLKIAYANEAVVYTEGASDLASLKRQRLRWKKGRFQTFYQYSHLFFSTKKRHNKILTWIVMPLAIIQDIQLSLEIPFLIFLYVFSLMNSDFSSYLTGIMVVGLMFFVQILFYEKNTRNISFILLAPIGWLLFYIATYVETWALFKSIESFIFKKEVVWQRWERKGVGVTKN